MGIDYTRLLEKLNPDPGAEDTLRLRVATVTTVNANGTLDLTMSSGVLVPGVPKLASAVAPAGAVVQVITLRGSLLVIGAVSGTAVPGSGVSIQQGTFNVVVNVSAATFSQVVTYPVAYPVGVTPRVFLNYTDGAAQAQLWILRATSIGNTSFNVTGSRTAAATLAASPVDWMAITRP